MRSKNSKNYFSILTIVNYRNWLNDSSPKKTAAAFLFTCQVLPTQVPSLNIQVFVGYYFSKHNQIYDILIYRNIIRFYQRTRIQTLLATEPSKAVWGKGLGMEYPIPVVFVGPALILIYLTG